jgi:radical SAM superfamily enzyme
MNVVELGNKLNKMYNTKGAKKTTMIHLFGIIYAKEIHDAGVTSLEVVKAAQLHESYQAEVNKGINLSQYVELKSEYKNMF